MNNCDRCLKPIEEDRDHGLYLCPLEPRSTATRYFQDQVPGGLWIENFAPNPIRFDSHSEKRAYMKKHGIIEHVKHVGVPGTDRSTETQRFV